MMNPADIFKMKSLWDRFSNNHPKFPSFLNAVARQPIEAGTIIEVSITRPEGKTIATNLKLTPDDMELINQLKSMSGK